MKLILNIFKVFLKNGIIYYRKNSKYARILEINCFLKTFCTNFPQPFPGPPSSGSLSFRADSQPHPPETSNLAQSVLLCRADWWNTKCTYKTAHNWSQQYRTHRYTSQLKNFFKTHVKHMHRLYCFPRNLKISCSNPGFLWCLRNPQFGNWYPKCLTPTLMVLNTTYMSCKVASQNLSPGLQIRKLTIQNLHLDM